ncbi:MAG: DEAD/DEAH box helicase family protein [Candidatus Binatia bacterium]
MRDAAVALTPAQQAAVDALLAARGDGFVAWLLHGVTGSGKTEVYLRAIAALPDDASALVLVPEISLTHQLVERVRARFHDAVAVLHSQLSVGERWDEWRRIARGEARLVVGARSAGVRAAAAPRPDHRRRGATTPRQAGRRRALPGPRRRVMRAGRSPAVRSCSARRRRRWRARPTRAPAATAARVAGARRRARPLPAVQLVDLRAHAAAQPPVPTPELAAALEANLAAGGQSLVFLNRRGFANFLQCCACGEPLMCPNCSVALTVYRRWGRRAATTATIPSRRQRPAASAARRRWIEWGVGTEQPSRRCCGSAFRGARGAHGPRHHAPAASERCSATGAPAASTSSSAPR